MPPVSCDRPVQAQRGRPGRERSRPPWGRCPVPPRLLLAWIANPRRLVPYTAMPQNIAPHGTVQILVPKTFENKPIEMVSAVRDTLLNYVNAVELQLASSGRDATPSGASRPRRRELPREWNLQQERQRNVQSLVSQAGLPGSELQCTLRRRLWLAAAARLTRAPRCSFPSPTV